MECPNCGKKLRENSRICKRCGEPIEQEQPASENEAAEDAKKPKKEHHVGQIIALILDILLIIAALLLLAYQLKTRLDTTLALSASEIYFFSDEEADVTFTATLSKTVDSVTLYRESSYLGEMHDDGLNGDAVAGDNVYTYVASAVSEPDAESVSYSAKAGYLTSDTVVLYYFRELTDEEAASAATEMEDLAAELDAMEAPYRNENGYVDAADVSAILAKAAAYLDEKVADGTVLMYEVESNNIYIKLTTGLSMVYTPSLEDTLANGSDVSLTIVTYQPNPDVAYSEMYDLVAQVAAAVDSCEYSSSNSYEGEEITLELIKSFGSNQLIFWSGHGGYSSDIGCFLCTGIQFSIERDYEDLVKGRVVYGSTSSQANMVSVTSKFIDYYCGALTNDFVILSSCHSGQDSVLADAFLNKGAIAVFGFTDTVYCNYADGVIETLLTDMSTVNLATGEYYTLSEAVEDAISVWGENDSVWAQSHGVISNKDETAAPTFFGGTAASEYQLGETGHTAAGIQVNVESLQDSAVYVSSDWDNWEPIRVYVALDGTPLTDSQMSRTSLNVSFSEDISYRYEKVAGSSAYDIYIGQDANGNQVDVPNGSYSLLVSVDYTDEYGESATSAVSECSFHVSTFALFPWMTWLLDNLWWILLVLAVLVTWKKLRNRPAFPKRVYFVRGHSATKVDVKGNLNFHSDLITLSGPTTKRTKRKVCRKKYAKFEWAITNISPFVDELMIGYHMFHTVNIGGHKEWREGWGVGNVDFSKRPFLIENGTPIEVKATNNDVTEHYKGVIVINHKP